MPDGVIVATHLRLVFPMPPNLANARWHWRTKQQRRDAWKTRALVNEPAIRVRRRQPLERVRVTAVLHVWRRMDDDNAVARLKWCLDLLRERGIIVDDKRPHLELTGIPEQVTGVRPAKIELSLEAA